MKIAVEVPATCANLGAGFDVFGVALGLKNRFEIETLPGRRGVEFNILNDGGSLPKDRTNLFYRAFRSVYRGGAAIRITIKKMIPETSGLGSSATAIIAGVMCGKLLKASCLPHDDSAFRAESVKSALRMECHPDNIIPAVYGGFCVSYGTDSGFGHEKFMMPRGLTAVVVYPLSGKRSTDYARRILPRMVPMKDAVFNIARAGLFPALLLSGRYSSLRFAMQDRLHQPKRAKLYPLFGAVLEKLNALGAYGAALSGSGPAVLGIFPASLKKAEVRTGICGLYERKGMKADVYFLPFLNTGTGYSVRY